MNYGPNTLVIKKLLEQAQRITLEQADRIAFVWESDWSATRGSARETARVIARVASRDTDWINARNAARRTVPRSARDAALDAVAVLLVQDLISKEHFNTLYGPWASVFGEPKG